MLHDANARPAPEVCQQSRGADGREGRVDLFEKRRFECRDTLVEPLRKIMWSLPIKKRFTPVLLQAAAFVLDVVDKPSGTLWLRQVTHTRSTACSTLGRQAWARPI